MRHVIIGGVAGGATAAARIRRIDEKAEIIIIERGPYISYANCGLPYYIGGVIAEREKLFVQTPEAFAKRFRIEVRVNQEALSIDPDKKTVLVRDAAGKEDFVTYDKLLLSPGAMPVKPPLEGIDLPGIFTLRNVLDTDQIKAYMEDHHVKRVVIVGAGFIGLEMAENLQKRGIEVAVVEMANQVMGPIDYAMASLVHQELIEHNVRLMLSKGVKSFRSADEDLRVTFQSGEEIATDMVLLSIGVRPETTLASKGHLKIGEAKGIWVDSYLQTSAPDVYAVGDAIEYPHPLTHKPWLNYLAGPANRQARIVATNMVRGNKQIYEGAIGTSIAKVFDLTVASTGLAAKRLQAMSIPYISSTTHGGSNAGYYPGALPLTIKVVFSPTDGKLYGAQVIGYKGVDKRIDQLAFLIKRGGTVEDLMALEQAYAPPFSSAKDPIAIAGYVAANILHKETRVLYWRDMRDALAGKSPIKGLQILDIRAKEEWLLNPIAGVTHIPLDELRDRLNELDPKRPLLVFCIVGLRGYLAQRLLQGNGFAEVYNLSGGLKIYKAAVVKIQTSLGAFAVKGSKNLRTVDLCGLTCPGPIVKFQEEMKALSAGEQLELISTDNGLAHDVKVWCQKTGNLFISNLSLGGQYHIRVEKGI